MKNPHLNVQITEEGKKKRLRGHEDPWGCEMSRFPHFWRTGSQMAVRLSALHTK
jgi:hypothetical protein